METNKLENTTILWQNLSFNLFNRFYNKYFTKTLTMDEIEIYWAKTFSRHISKNTVTLTNVDANEEIIINTIKQELLISDSKIIINVKIETKEEEDGNDETKNDDKTETIIKEPKPSYIKRRVYKYTFPKPKENETQLDRAIRLADAYKDKDDFFNLDNDIKPEWIVEHIFTQKCTYCGCNDWKKLGCDRIDNSIGHIMENCVPACISCNMKRRTIPQDKFIEMINNGRISLAEIDIHKGGRKRKRINKKKKIESKPEPLSNNSIDDKEINTNEIITNEDKLLNQFHMFCERQGITYNDNNLLLINNESLLR